MRTLNARDAGRRLGLGCHSPWALRLGALCLLLAASCDGCNGSSEKAPLDAGVKDASIDIDAYLVYDPPAMYCDIDGGMIPTPSVTDTGTATCPSDKNLPNCPCTAAGVTAACWPGSRATRNIGNCKDGTTTCVLSGGEIKTLVWGPCQGFVPPSSNASASGADRCECFSQGQWKIANLSPCLFADTGAPAGSGGAFSTIPQDGGLGECAMDSMGRFIQPSVAWSTDTVNVDCAGRYQLCYTIKAGDVNNPQATDCVMSHVCVVGDYAQANVEQDFPPLPAWTGTDPACSQQFAASGGYGEMTVNGSTVRCDQLDKVFHRVTYCKYACNSTPNDPACASCFAGGSGVFTK